MGKPPCRDVSTPPLRPLPSLSSLPSLRSLPAPTHTLRQRGRRGQLLAVGANAMGLAQSVGLLLSTDRSVKGAAGSGGRKLRTKLFGWGESGYAQLTRLSPYAFFTLKSEWFSAWARRDQLTSAEPQPRPPVGASFSQRQICHVGRNPPRLIVNNFAADPAPASYLNTLIGCYSKSLITHAPQASRTSIAFNENSVRRLNAFSGRGIM